MVMANRLKKAVGLIISKSQKTFMRGDKSWMWF